MKELLKKVEKLNLRFKMQTDGGNKKRNEKSKRKITHQPLKTNLQFKVKTLKSQSLGEKSKLKISQVKSPSVAGTWKLNLG